MSSNLPKIQMHGVFLLHLIKQAGKSLLLPLGGETIFYKPHPLCTILTAAATDWNELQKTLRLDTFIPQADLKTHLNVHFNPLTLKHKPLT